MTSTEGRAPLIGFINPQATPPSDDDIPPSYAELFPAGLNPLQPTSTDTTFTKPHYDVVPVHLTRKSTALVCPYCFKQTLTIAEEMYPNLVWCWFCCLCCCGCPCLGWVPFNVIGAESVDHYCGKCKQYLGVSYEDNPLLRDQVEQIRREQRNY